MFGAVRAGLLLMVATLAVESLQTQRQLLWWQESVTAPWLSMALRTIAPVLPMELLQNLPW